MRSHTLALHQLALEKIRMTNNKNISRIFYSSELLTRKPGSAHKVTTPTCRTNSFIKETFINKDY